MIEYKDRGLHKINKDKISFSFTKNKNKCVKIGFLFYYVTHTKEYIHNLIINGMKQGDSESINTLYEYYSFLVCFFF